MWGGRLNISQASQRFTLLMIIAAAAAGPVARRSTGSLSNLPFQSTGSLFNMPSQPAATLLLETTSSSDGWHASFTVDQVFDPPGVFHAGLAATIPWDDTGQILRKEAKEENSEIQNRLKDAIHQEDYLLASKLKDQLTAGADAVISDKVWGDLPPADARKHVTAVGLKRTAKGVWRGIVDGITSAFAPDLHDAEQLVLTTLDRAAELGGCHVQIRPIQTFTPQCTTVTHCRTSCSSGCLTGYQEDWQQTQSLGWMQLPMHRGQAWACKMIDGAICWAVSQEIDTVRQENLRSLSLHKSDIFDIVNANKIANTNGQLLLNSVHQPSNIDRVPYVTHEILSDGDFCQVAASTLVQMRTVMTITGTDPPPCPEAETVRHVMVVFPEDMECGPWVFGENAGMLHTIQRLELEWNATVNAVQSAVATKQLARSSLMEVRHSDSSIDTRGDSIPNFLGPIGPNQPPAKPWDLSRYDILLNIADRQRTQGMLTQQQHTQVSEQLVLAGRFHRAHAAFETALNPKWVESLHKVLEHPVARKILVWKLRNAGINVSITPQFARVRYANREEGARGCGNTLFNKEKIEVACALDFDLHHPLPHSPENKTLVDIFGEGIAEMDELLEFVAADLI